MPATGSSSIVPVSEINKCTLVPASFMEGQDPGCILSDLFPDFPQDAKVSVEPIRWLDASLVYVGEALPPLGFLLMALPAVDGHNKILADLSDGVLSLAIAEGDSLLLASCYPAPDFTTAQFFIFSAMKSLQLNPEISAVRFRSPLTQEQEMSLYRYFKSVESL